LSKSRNFEYRPHQQKMAVAVARALEEREHLIVEAGTGVGKSLAYLIPSILFAVAHHKKAVISTHTINLQEQLIDKDLPMLAKILPVKFNFTMLKGRQNYLCTRRLEKVARQAGQLFTSPQEEELRRIHEWSKKTEDGSLSDFEIEPDPVRTRIMLAQNVRAFIRFCERRRPGVFLSTGPQPDSGGRCPGAQSHFVLHAPGRIGGGVGGRDIVQE
jgi:Rad3-related DNA helicase